MYRCMNPSAIGITLDWESCLPIARNASFEGIDLVLDVHVAASWYREELDRHGLKVGGMSLPLHMRDDEAAFSARLEALPAIATRAREVGLTRFHTWIMPWSETLTWKENFRFHVERLGMVARVLEREGCRLGLEFLGPRTCREGHRYSFAHTMEGMLDLCAAVGGNCGLLLDSWHWHTSLGTIEEIAGLSSNQVVYVHINDAPAGIPIEQQQDLVRRIPGETGVIDLPGFLAALRRIGYDGPVVPEPFEKSLGEMAPADAAARVGTALKRIWNLEPTPALPKTMKAVATGRGKAWLVDQEVPRPEGNQVVVKLYASPICGSVMGCFHGDGEWVNVGHEGAGEVVAVAQSHSLRVGDRVALAPLNACGVCAECRAGDGIYCRHRPAVHGTFSQFTRISDSLCTVLPDDIEYDHGSLLGCCLGPAFRAVRTLAAAVTDEVVVAGLGPVGMGAVALASWFGASVIALDPEEYRRKLALKLGARLTIDPADGDPRAALAAATGGRGVLKAIECSGSGASQRLLVDAAAVHATIAFVGENQGTIALSPSRDFIRKGLTITGCWHMNVHDAPLLLPLLRRQREQADLLISHRIGFGKAQEAFEIFASRKCVKVILKPWE